MNFFDLYKTSSIAFFAYLTYLLIIDCRKRHTLRESAVNVCLYVIAPSLIMVQLSLYIVEPLTSIIVVIVLSILKSRIEKGKLSDVAFYFGVSYALSHALYLVSAFVSSVLFVVLFNVLELNIYAAMTIFVFETIFIIIARRKKLRFTPKHKSIAGIGMMLSGVILFITGVFYAGRPISDNSLTLLLSAIILCGFGLYRWLKRESITAFNMKAQELVNEKLQEEIAELTSIRLDLEKTLHNKNKKLPAYREAVERAITAGDTQTKVKVLKALYEATTTETGAALSSHTLLLLNVIFDYYKGRCSQKGIRFSHSYDGASKITEIIAQSQLETLVTNLVDNAIKSFSGSNADGDKYIIVRLWSVGLSIEDNGAAFNESFLDDLARCKEMLTPNREGGGVGLGWVSIFEIANACDASVEVVESDGVKSVTMRFDGKGRIVVSRSREEVKI